MAVPFIDLKAQYRALRSSIDSRMQKVLEHGAYVNGPEILELEQKLSEFTKAPYVLACSSGTDALVLPLMALGIGPGDEVITTNFSFIATAEVIHLVGAQPIYADIEPVSYNIDVSKIEKLITPRTKAILPVSLYGQISDMDEIQSLANKYGLHVIEDSAQSFGASYRDRYSGNVSELSGTSFFPAKPLGGYGDGGAVFTQNESLYKRMKEIREHGSESRYYHTCLGVNARLDTLQCAILLAKMERYPFELEQRQKWGQRYNRAFEEISLKDFQPPHLKSYNSSAWAQYTLAVPDRTHFQKRMTEMGIPTAVHYPRIMPEQPWYKAHLNQEHREWPVGRWAADHVISLPIYPDMTEKIQDEVIQAVFKALK